MKPPSFVDNHPSRFKNDNKKTNCDTHLLHISPDLQATQQDHGLLGLGDALHLVGDDQRELGHSVNDVALGLDQGGHTGGGDGRHDGEPLLVHIDPAVPAAVGHVRGEHASTTAHVAEGSLAGAVGTTSAHTGDTGDSATSSPGLGGRLVAGLLADGVRLAGVALDQLVHVVDDVRADGRLEDRRQRDLRLAGLILLRVDAHEGASSRLTLKKDRRANGVIVGTLLGNLHQSRRIS